MNKNIISLDISYLQQILKEANFLISCFYNEKNEKVEDSDTLYDMNNFLKTKKDNKINYILLLDRNIFDYIIKSTKKNTLVHRQAIALVIWGISYLSILVLCDIYYDDLIVDKFRAFYNWMKEKSILLLSVLVYAIFLFVKPPYGNIMKFNPKTNRNTIRELENMKKN